MLWFDEPQGLLIGSELFLMRSQMGFSFQIRPQVDSSRSTNPAVAMFGYNKPKLIGTW